jgi:hypothetical protein
VPPTVLKAHSHLVVVGTLVLNPLTSYILVIEDLNVLIMKFLCEAKHSLNIKLKLSPI